MGSGCGSVGTVVASDTRGAQFESVIGEISIEHLITVNCIEKTKIKQKESRNGPFMKSPGLAHCKLRFSLA